MKIGVLSDIHGNIDALKAVLNMAKKQKVDKLLVLGDFVGYYYHPKKVINALSNWDCELIKGNHEVILQELIEGKQDYTQIRKKYGSGHQRAIQELNKDEIEMLCSLPSEKSVTIDGVNILMCHGANFDETYYLYPNEKEEVLEQCNSKQHEFIFVGHSHYPFVKVNQDSTLVNVGSIGQSRLSGGVANWVILHTENKSIQFMNSSYKTEDLIEEVTKTDPRNEYLWKILKRNNE